MIGQFIGIFISGGLPFREFDFAFLDINKISIPVIPPEITPPIPRIVAKLRRLSFVIIIYRISGMSEAKRTLVPFFVLMSYLNVSFRENDRTK